MNLITSLLIGLKDSPLFYEYVRNNFFIDGKTAWFLSREQMKPLLRLCYLSASQDPVDGRWSLVIISPSFHFWGILEQSRINIEWLKVNCFKIFSTYHMIWALFCNRFWEIYDCGTSLSCMHTNCVQKVRAWLLFWIVESRQLNLLATDSTLCEKT